MSTQSGPRQPRAFDPTDPSIVEEPLAPAEPEASAAEAAAPMTEAGGLSRPARQAARFDPTSPTNGITPR